MNSKLKSALKLSLVAALMTYVFTSIQWRDTYTVVGSDGKAIETVTGRIVGDWEADPVEFRVDGTARELTTGPRGDGTNLEVAPGFLTYVRNLDWGWFALGSLCYLFSLTLAATRWWWLLRVNGLDVHWLEAQRFTWIGVFYNNVVPGQTGGDLVKALYIMKRCPGSRVAALLSVVVDRIIGLGSLALLGAVVVLFQFERFRALAFGIWGVLLAVSLIGVVAFSRRVRRAIRLDALIRKLPGRVSGLLMRVDEAVYFYRAHKAGIFVWLLIGVFNHMSSVSAFVLMGIALGVGMPPAEYFVLVPVILIVSAVPIGPNGWGVGEALFRQLFGVYGAANLPPGTLDPQRVMGTRGVALSVCYRIHSTLWSLLGGVMSLCGKDRVTRADVEAEKLTGFRGHADPPASPSTSDETT